MVVGMAVQHRKRYMVRIFLLLFFLSLAACATPGGHRTSELPQVNDYHAGLIKQLNSKDKNVRHQAANQLVKIGRPAVPALLEALTGEAETAQFMAANVLGDIKDPRAVEPLIWALGVSSPTTRRNAAYALGEIGDERAANPLSRLLNDPEKEVLEGAQWSLRRTDRTGVSFAELIQAGNRPDIDSSVEGTHLFYALVEIRNNLTTLRELARALSHSSSLVRKEVARHLGTYFKEHAADPKKHPEALAALLKASRDTVPEVRGLAIWALGQTKDPGALPRLVDGLDDRELEARKYAALAVAEADQNLSAFPAFAKAYVREANTDHFHDALKIMGKRKTSYKPFVQWLVYPDADVRKVAAWGIGVAARDVSVAPRQLRHVGAVEQLLRNLETEEDSHARHAVIWALGYVAEHGDDHVVEILSKEVLRGYRISAINALARIGEVDDSRFVGEILRWLNFEVTADNVYRLYNFQVDEKTQLAAAKAVGRLVSPESTRSITSVLSSLDEDRYRSNKVRLVVLESLAEIASHGQLDLSHYKHTEWKEPWELLEPYLASPEPVQRLHAATVLANLGDPRAIEPLIALIDRDDSKTSLRAATALAQMDDVRAVRALIAAFKKADSSLKNIGRVQIAKALAVQKHDQGIRFLISSLNNSKGFEMLDAATGLATAGDPRGIDRLLNILKDDIDNLAFFVPDRLKSINSDVVTDSLLAAIPRAFLPEGYTLAVKRAGSRAIRPIIESYLNRGDKVGLLDSYYVIPLFQLATRSQLVVNAYLSGDEDEIALLPEEERKEAVRIITGFAGFLSHEDPFVRRVAFVALSLSEALPFVELPPVSPVAEMQMEQAFIALGRATTRHELETAEALFKRTVDMTPWWAEARFNLGLIYEELGNKKGAVQEMKYYLQLRPDADDAEKNRTRINRLEGTR